MATYKVKGIHHRKAWIKGDLKAEDVLIDSESFSTKKALNEFIKNKETEFTRNGYKIRSKYVARGNEKTELLAFTGNSWIHENSGEKHEEYYWYYMV